MQTRVEEEGQGTKSVLIHEHINSRMSKASPKMYVPSYYLKEERGKQFLTLGASQGEEECSFLGGIIVLRKVKRPSVRRKVVVEEN